MNVKTAIDDVIGQIPFADKHEMELIEKKVETLIKIEQTLKK